MPNWSDVHAAFLAASPTLWLEQAEHLTSRRSMGALAVGLHRGMLWCGKSDVNCWSSADRHSGLEALKPWLALMGGTYASDPCHKGR